MGSVRIFVSAASTEFKPARQDLAQRLRRSGREVLEQDSFTLDPANPTLLGKLHDFIATSTFVGLIGTIAGSRPPREAAEHYKPLVPPALAWDDLSYTQWELIFALHHRRPFMAFKPAAGFPRLTTAVPDAQQQRFLDFLDRSNIDLTQAPDSVDALHREVLEGLAHRQPQTPSHKPIVLPYPSIGTLFKGRDTFMQRLRTSLTRDGTAAIAGRAVHGLGGVGKTRTAVEYAWAHRDAYNAIALLDAETPDRLQASLAALTGPLLLPEQQAQDDAVKIEAAVKWLNANPGWFLILDNLDTPVAVAAANRLLGRLTGGHAVLTSRLSAGFARGVERLDLDVLDPEAAAAFLLEATGKPRDQEPEARALAADLGQLALALEMAAATIEARGLSFAAYRKLWEGNRARVVGWASQKITGYHHAVAETWQTSVDQLTPGGRALLERLAFLAPEPVPRSLLAVPVPEAAAPSLSGAAAPALSSSSGLTRGPPAAPTGDAPPPRMAGSTPAMTDKPAPASVAAADEDPEAALDDLVAYSLVTRGEDDAPFLMHRLVQDVTRRGLATEGREKDRLTEALGWVDDAFEGDPQDVREWQRLDPLAEHAVAVAEHAEAAGIADPTARLMGALDFLFVAKAQYVRAERMSRAALRLVGASRGPDHTDLAIRLNNLATLLQATNRLGEAEPLMRRALAIDEASYGQDHPRVATDLNNLATLLQATNRLGEAEPLMRRALAIDEASHGDAHPDVARDLNNLAQLLQATNRPGEAEPLMRRALAIDEASHGDAHPNVAIHLNNLATLLQATNRLGEAEPLMRRALAIDEASYDDAHPNVAIRLNNLATLLQATNRLGEAEPLMRRALAIDEASYGAAHPRVATDLNNLGILLFQTGRAAEAEPLMRRMAVIFLRFERDTGHKHPNGDMNIGNYAQLLAAMDRDAVSVDAALSAARREAGWG